MAAAKAARTPSHPRLSTPAKLAPAIILHYGVLIEYNLSFSHHPIPFRMSISISLACENYSIAVTFRTYKYSKLRMVIILSLFFLKQEITIRLT